MFVNFVKTVVKVVLALGAVFAGLVVLQRILEDKNDYIEIYNSGEDEDLFT